MEFRPHRAGQEEGESEIGIGKWSWIWMHAGACPGCHLGRRHNDTSLPTAVAVVGMKGGQAADLGPNQTRRHIVPALKAGGRSGTNKAVFSKRMTASYERRRTPADPPAYAGRNTCGLAWGARATTSSAMTAEAAGLKQSEQPSSCAQALPACSQEEATSSQAQRSVASAPAVAQRNTARKANHLERTALTLGKVTPHQGKSSGAEPRASHSMVVASHTWIYPELSRQIVGC